MTLTGYVCTRCSTNDEEIEFEVVEQFGRTYAECPGGCGQSYPYS